MEDLLDLYLQVDPFDQKVPASHCFRDGLRNKKIVGKFLGNGRRWRNAKKRMGAYQVDHEHPWVRCVLEDHDHLGIPEGPVYPFLRENRPLCYLDLPVHHVRLAKMQIFPFNTSSI